MGKKMRGRISDLWLVVISVAVAGWLAAGNTWGADIQVGLAQADITPPLGGRTTGYSGAQPTDGLHDPLTARVVLLQSSDLTVALVSWDLCVVNSPWLFEQVKALGIDHLLLANTHTHAGPQLTDMDFPSADQPWRRTVEERVLAAVKEAQGNRFPASFAAGEGAITLGYNRLVRQEGGYALTHFENPELVPYGPVDPTVGVIRITDPQHVVRAVLVNYACHPVVLGPQNRKLSADYPGVMRRLVEQHLGEKSLCVFLQGCCGDINPLRMARGDDRTADFEVVEQVGRDLAQEVIQVLDRMGSEAGRAEQLRIASSTLSVQGRWDPQITMDLGVTTLLVNDDIAILTMPGEPFHRFQREFREKAGVEHAWIFGYCCDGPYDWPSYLPDLEAAACGGYGASDTTRAEVGAGERLVQRGLVQLYTLQGRLKDKPVRHIRE